MGYLTTKLDAYNGKDLLPWLGSLFCAITVLTLCRAHKSSELLIKIKPQGAKFDGINYTLSSKICFETSC